MLIFICFVGKLLLSASSSSPFMTGPFLIQGCVQEVDGPFRCNGGVKSFTLDPKKRNQPKQH